MSVVMMFVTVMICNWSVLMVSSDAYSAIKASWWPLMANDVKWCLMMGENGWQWQLLVVNDGW